DDELVAMANLAKMYPIEVRFIEFMPFNGGQFNKADFISEKAMIQTLEKEFDLSSMKREFGDTSQQFSSPDFKGTVGTIAAYTRNFCGACNRLRIDAKGQLRNCLYGQSKDTLKNLLRSGASNESIAQAILNEVHHKPKDGFEAEKLSTSQDIIHESMSTIGG
ncbi:MAG: cyclic pyranopterin phosphate synthase MoaA, partial [Flavobacteriales bacterium]